MRVKSFTQAFSTAAFRVTAVAVGGFLIAAAAISGLMFWQSNRVLTEQVLESLRLEATRLARDASQGSPQAMVAAIAALSQSQGPGVYFLADMSGQKLAGNLSRLPPELDVSPGGAVFHYSQRLEDTGAQRLAVAIPVATPPGFRLIVGRDIEDLKTFADDMRRVFLIGFGGLSMLGLLGGLAVSRHVLGRMEQITATSRSIMDGNLSRRIPVDGTGSELDRLAGNLNDMLDRIESLMNGLREVSDNIAHDLKTPLNRLRNSAEAALRDARGGPAYREGLERTIETADDLIKTFNALLLIARLEAGPLEESIETFDLAGVVGDVTELYEPAADEAGFSLDLSAPARLMITGNRQLIGQAVANLIDNAIKYSVAGAGEAPAHRDIKVSVMRRGGGIELAVADRGQGIAPEDRERVLKRFVRLEKSRTKPGTGLGLSLVTAVARLHGGVVRLEDNAPGLRIVIALPGRILHDDIREAEDLKV